MNHKLIRKFALLDMQKSKKTLVPYLIAGAMTVMVYYILCSLAFCPYLYSNHVEAFYGAQTIAIFLELGSRIVVIFAAIFLIYANNFVMKGKKREIGLYGILGLSKRNVAVLLLFETVINAFISIVVGVLLGTILNKLMLLFLYKIIGQSAVNGFFFSATAFFSTLIVFGVINLVCLVYNISTISLGNPIELLRSDKAGEKEPKIKWIPVIIGVVTLVGGYYIALKVKTTMEAIEQLFGAIFLVIIGTYCLFTTGSIFLLKILKKNRNYYYKTRHFISVSNLMYRMKHNAAGLASICILSTGVILLLTCASSLMALGEKNLKEMYPRDVKVMTYNNDKNEELEKLISVGKNCGIEIELPVAYAYKTATIKKLANGIETATNENMSSYDDMAQAYFYTLEEYKDHSNSELSLKDNEILLYTTDKISRDVFYIGDMSFDVVGTLDYNAVSDTRDTSMGLFDGFYLVFANSDIMSAAFEKVISGGIDYDNTLILLGFNTLEELDSEQTDEIRSFYAGGNYEISFAKEDRVFFYNTYGGVFFVGLFLAILLLGATVLIIYYKQMSEGFEDQKRYKILKNVGLTDKEVRVTIKNQVMLIFFLPVVTAIIHMFFAGNIVRVFLGMILLVDAFTFNMAIIIVDAVFLIIYAIVYKITSGEYYKIVNAIN